MSYHDIYTINRKPTGMKFTSKTSYLRDLDEYSLNINLFIVFENYIILEKKDEGQFQAIESMLLASESSINAVERCMHDYFAIDTHNNMTKIISTVTIENNIYDIWVYKASRETFETIINMKSNFEVFNIAKFITLIETKTFKGNIDKSQVNDIFDIKVKSNTKPLFIKSNLY